MHSKPPNHIQIKNILCFGKKKTYFLFLNFKIGEFFAKMLKILFFPLELNCCIVGLHRCRNY